MLLKKIFGANSSITFTKSGNTHRQNRLGKFLAIAGIGLSAFATASYAADAPETNGGVSDDGTYYTDVITLPEAEPEAKQPLADMNSRNARKSARDRKSGFSWPEYSAFSDVKAGLTGVTTEARRFAAPTALVEENGQSIFEYVADLPAETVDETLDSYFNDIPRFGGLVKGGMGAHFDGYIGNVDYRLTTEIEFDTADNGHEVRPGRLYGNFTYEGWALDIGHVEGASSKLAPMASMMFGRGTGLDGVPDGEYRAATKQWFVPGGLSRPVNDETVDEFSPKVGVYYDFDHSGWKFTKGLKVGASYMYEFSDRFGAREPAEGINHFVELGAEYERGFKLGFLGNSALKVNVVAAGGKKAEELQELAEKPIVQFGGELRMLDNRWRLAASHMDMGHTAHPKDVDQKLTETVFASCVKIGQVRVTIGYSEIDLKRDEIGDRQSLGELLSGLPNNPLPGFNGSGDDLLEQLAESNGLVDPITQLPIFQFPLDVPNVPVPDFIHDSLEAVFIPATTELHRKTLHFGLETNVGRDATIFADVYQIEDKSSLTGVYQKTHAAQVGIRLKFNP